MKGDTPDQPWLHARRRPGRPRKHPKPEETANPAHPPADPRRLDLARAAHSLSVSPWTIRDLERAGILHRVRIPLAHGRDLRKLLFDREELERLIDL